MPQQVPRLAVVFILAIVALVVARALLIPETFGELGHYRAAAESGANDQAIFNLAVLLDGAGRCREARDHYGRFVAGEPLINVYDAAKGY